MPDIEETRINIFLHAENIRIFNSTQERTLPVAIVTGFLGAGKTTLLNHILSNKSNLRIAAAINDFAELNIDENLVRSKGNTSKLVELSNGCVCCNLLDDLKEAVWKMLESGGDVDTDAINYLVVETSGVSDPLEVIRTLDAKFGKCFRVRLDSVVTVVDSDQLSFCPPSAAAIAQLKCADVVIMNKIDLLEDQTTACDLVEARIRLYNPKAVIHRTKHCNVPLSAILDVDMLPDAQSRTSGGVMTHEQTQAPIYVSATGGSLRLPTKFAANSNAQSLNTDAAVTHNGRDKFVSVAVTVKSRPISLSKFQHFVCSPIVQSLSRMKGVLWIEGIESYRCVIHLSGRGRLGFELDGLWEGPPVSDIAFIGSMLNPKTLRDSFTKCCAPDIANSCDKAPEEASCRGLELLRNREEFQIWSDSYSKCTGLSYFRLVGEGTYGYSEEEIERDLRIDTDAMNSDLADAVNASVDTPKAFLAYTHHRKGKIGASKVVLCFFEGSEPANNMKVLVREARKILSAYFRNVPVCKCGA